MIKKTKNHLSEAWAKLTTQQRWTLGVLSFFVFILPLSLLVIKTQTNIFPKAAVFIGPPATAPITSPTPSASPTPIADRCQACTYAEPMPGTPEVKCEAGLICKIDIPECVIKDGHEVCPQIAISRYAVGKCVKPEEKANVCEAVPLSGHCEKCNNSLPPTTPNSRCRVGLTCQNTTSETCHTMDNGQVVCTAVEGGYGVCLKPGESKTACSRPCTDVAGSCIGKMGNKCVTYTNGCQANDMCKQPLESCSSLPCGTTCWSDSQCSVINPSWSCHYENPLQETGSCRLKSNPESTTCEEATLSNYCESCDPSLPPSTPNSRCVEGLTCKTEEPECFEEENGSVVCAQIEGDSGLCVKPEETVTACQNPTPIDLSGNTLPKDNRIRFQRLAVNEALLPFQPAIFSKTVTLNEQDLLIKDSYGEPGYGEFFVFYPSPGMKFEILAKELDIQSVGSYIETAFYGPDKRKINNVGTGTRIQYDASSRLPYYLAVYTFDHKKGRAEVTVTNKNRIYNKAYIKRIDQDMRPLNNGEKLGRKAADFFLQVPRIDNINNEYITYTSQTDNTLKTEIPRIKVTKTCPLTGETTAMPIGIRKFNNPNHEPLREIQMKIYPLLATFSPADGAYYPPGYDYVVNLEYPNPQMSWITRFSTTGQSGVIADLNDDNTVDISDYSLLVSELMQSDNFLVADLNCDGVVDISDYSLLINNFSL